MINKTHLKELKSSLEKDGCIEPVSIFFGAEYFEAYPERELTNLNDGDRKYTKDSPEVPEVIFVADGVHRVQAHVELLSEDESYKHTLRFRHVETDLPIDRWIYVRNTNNRNWDSKDCSRYIAAQTGYEKAISPLRLNGRRSINCVRDIHTPSLTFPAPIRKECCRSIWMIPRKVFPQF